MKIIYPGTFDPVTLGHMDIIRRARNIFADIEVAVVERSSKALCFSIEDRVGLMRESLAEVGIKGIQVVSFDCLLVEYMKSRNYHTFIRGLRANSDFEYEFQMQLMNRRLAPDITGLYLMPSEDNMYLSSTLVKEIAGYGGDLSTLVTDCVRKSLERAFSRT
ncbi:MAG: pantetheine-phosphate adenylyltransferase [Candidatus Fermentibacteraceae bacterium]|nr:pantetheine-phosphate adenylyltransferase [Candidatus Fermentibacteraceae bacterium]MBN2609061.1 pantetheine-phosphate adenylyltransferase [Candidatus Fermentibacteraceae bacterium]